MKTKTLVVAALMACVLMAVSFWPRSNLSQAVADDAAEAPVAVEAEPLLLAQADAPEAEVLDAARRAVDAADVMEEPAAEDEADLIELDTERRLSPGIDVAMGDEGQDLISITLDDVPIQDVVRMFTRISGANIVAGTNLNGSVTVSLQDVEWEPAFRVILDSVDMVLVEKTRDIYTIMSKGALAAEPVTVDTVFLNFSTVSNVLPVVERMLVTTNASVSAFPSANALVIQETAARLNTIKDVITQIDLPRPQVYIEAKFVELNDSAITDIGIDWSALGSDESGLGYTLAAGNLGLDHLEIQRKFFMDTLADFDVDQLSDTRITDRGDINGDQRQTIDAASALDVFLGGRNFTTLTESDGTISIEPVVARERIQTYTALLSPEDFELTLSALNQDAGVDVLSNPKVIVANEETAVIHVGRNEPNVIAVPQGDTGDRFAFTLDSRQPFIEIGVKLEVTPTVNTEENITVRLTPELSRLIGQKEVGEGSTRITFPITQIRKVTTQFNLESGSTVAIGGLTETTEEESIKKIPVLGDIPLLGKYLFRHTHTENIQDEVIIFVTVGLANPEGLVEVAGVPSEGQLIHEHLAKRAAQEAAEE